MPGPLLEIEFFGLQTLIGHVQRVDYLLYHNLEVAVRRTVIWGAQRIASDTPVLTGELVASIGGDVVDTSSGSNGTATAKGRSQSRTSVDGLTGVIGTAVRHAIHQEFGWTQSSKKLTPKQIRFLFAVGILKRGSDGSIVYEGRKIAGKPTARRNRKIKGRAMFRKNIPAIRRYFWAQCAEAVALALQGKEMAA